jgi:alpha-tubulin suppressor-like RCC1 family protein
MIMGKRFGVVCAAGLALAPACSDTPSSAPIAKSSSAVTTATTPTINNFVVYAANNMTLGANDKSQGGNLGVATSNGASPQLAIGSQVQVDTQHTVYAPSVSVATQAVVGAVDANTVANNGGQIGTQSGYPTSMPPLPAVFPATAGPTNVTVSQGQQQTLSPGSFGALTDDGILFLNPGTYSFASVTLGNNAQLQALQGNSTSINVVGGLSTGTSAQILPAGQAANALTISVSAADGANGSPPAVSLGNNTQIVGLLAAPNGTVSFGNNVQATGAFAGLNFSAGTQVVLNFQSGFANAQPSLSTFVAYAELALTLGSGDQTLGGDLGVGANASSSSAQLVVGSQDHLDVQHTLYAPSVSLASGAVVGDVGTGSLTNSGGQFESEAPYFVGAMPLLPLAIVGTPGPSNVTVSQGTQQTLSPGSFGALVDDGILFLHPGTYSFASVTLGNNAQLQALQGGSTTIGVSGTLATGTAAQLFPVGQQAGNLTISVAGSDGTNGSPPAVSLGNNTQIIALLDAPNGTLSLGNSVQGIGAFIGFNLSAGTNVALTFQTGFPPSSQQPSGQQQLSGYVTGSTTGAPLVGPVPASTVINMAVALPVGVPQTGPYAGMTLSQVAQAVSNPTNAMYRQYISDANYALYYTPTANAYTTLTTFLTSTGLTIINNYADNELVDVSGTAQQIEQMLFVNLNYYLRPDGTQFYAPDRQPSLMVSEPVLQVAGTDNYVLGTHGGTCSTEQNQQRGSGRNGWLMGPDFRNAYLSSCASALTGSGQAIGLLEGEGFNPTDFTAYQQAASAIASAQGGTTFPLVNPLIYTWEAGVATQFFEAPFLNQQINASGSFEAPADVELAWAMAPEADIVVYQAPNTGEFAANFADDILHRMANPDSYHARVMTLSSSWFFNYDRGAQQSLDSMAAHGQTFFQVSGDGGAMVYNGYQQLVSVGADNTIYTSAPPDIRIANNITLVGATDLVSFGAGRAPSEVPWYTPTSDVNGGTGGGYWGPIPAIPRTGGFPGVPEIPGFGLPLYQMSAASSYESTSAFTTTLGPGFFGSTSYRNFPDVSAAGQDAEEMYTTATPVSQSGSIQAFTGSSVAGPLWAGFNALANQASASAGIPPVGFANPMLYAIASASNALYSATFNDVKTGCNAPVPQAGINTGNAHGGPGDAAQIALAESAGLPSSGFPAETGYDMASGLGSFTCGLITQLASVTPTVPVPAVPPTPAIVSFAGIGLNDSCVVINGSSQCWGTNVQGEEGNGNTNQQLTPSCISSLPAGAVQQVAAGTEFACALLAGGTVSCWGENGPGSLGAPVGASSYTPTPVQGLPAGDPVTQIVAGGTSACAVTQSNNLWCWGTLLLTTDSSDNAFSASAPQLTVSGGLVAQAAISTSGGFMCFLETNGDLYCLGDNDYGQLGNGTFTSSGNPSWILSGVTSFSTGDRHACATTGGFVECWGANDSSELGNGEIIPIPTPLGSQPGVSNPSFANNSIFGVGPSIVACGGGFTCALTFTQTGLSSTPPTGSVYCVGANGSGQLGNGTTGGLSETWVAASMPSDVIGISAGEDRVCAEHSGGAISCWGAGPAGDGMNDAVSTPSTITPQRCL